MANTFYESPKALLSLDEITGHIKIKTIKLVIKTWNAEECMILKENNAKKFHTLFIQK